MSVRNDVINLTVNINGSAAQNQLNELRKRAADLTFEMKNNLTKGTQEYITAAKDLKQVNAEMTNLKQSIGLSALSLKELSAEQKNLTALFRSAQPGTQAYKDFENQLKAVILRQKELSANTSGFTGVATSSFNSIKQSITSLALGYVGFQAVITGVRALTAGAIKLSDQLGDLRRIAGLTKDEANNLNHSLLQIDTRTSGEGLRSIAIVAGKLGVAKEDIFSFTKAVDKLVVTLGDELGNADQITTQLGKILNVFEGKVTGENISKLGNAFVELANAGVATGGFIADFTQRVSGIAKASNLSLGSTVGLAAGFEELGLRSESSSTALQKLLTTIASDLPKAAKFANVPLKEFSQLFAEKPQEALIKYAEGLAKNKNSFAEIAASFKDADEKGARVVQTLQAIGQKGDFLREKIDQGNTSIERQTALNDGFAIKNENLAGTIEKLGKAFDKLIANERVTNFLQGIINTLSGAITGIEDFIDSFDSLDQAVTKITKKHEADLANFASEIGGEFEKKSIAEQQKLADSYKSIYISSQKALTEFLKSGNGDIAQRNKLLDQQNQDEQIYLATQKKLQEALAKQKKETPPNTPPPDSADTKVDSEYKRLLKEAKKFYEDILKLREKSAAELLPDDEKEIRLVEDKYNELFQKAEEFHRKLATSDKRFSEEEKILFAARADEIAKIRQKQFGANSDKEYEAQKIADASYFENLQDQQKRFYAEGKIDKLQYEDAIKDIEYRELNQRIRTANDYAANSKKAASDVAKTKKDLEHQITKDLQAQLDARIKLIQANAAAETDIRNIKAASGTANLQRDNTIKNAKDDRNATIALLKEDLKASGQAFDDEIIKQQPIYQAAWDKFNKIAEDATLTAKQKRIQALAEIGQQLINITGSVFQVLDNLDQNKLAKEKKVNDAKLASYKKLLEAKLLSQKQYDSLVTKQDADYAKKKHEIDVKAFHRQQELAILTALINGALAIGATYAARAGLADIFTLGVARAIEVGLVVASTAAQVAAISTQKPPEAGEGGLITNGPYHKDPSRGLSLIDPTTGKTEMLLEKDEAILKGDAVRDPKKYTVTGTPSQITSKLNAIHGGVNWASGASIQPAFRQQPPQINASLPRILEQGGLVRPITGNQAANNATDQNDLLRQLITEQQQTREEIKNFNISKKSYVTIKDIDEARAKYNFAKKSSGIN